MGLNFQNMPGTRELLFDRFFRKARRYQLPSIMATIIQATTLQSDNKSKAALKNVDLLFNPNLNSFGLLAWNKFDTIEEAGYRHAMKILEKWDGFKS